MSIVGGLAGYVNQDDTVVGSIMDWTIDYTGEPTTVVTSATKLGTQRLAGNKDWSGKYKAAGAVPVIQPGTFFLFEGSVDDTNGFVSAAGGAYLEGVVIDWDIEGGGIMTHEASFSAHGVLTLGPVTGTPDSTLPPVDQTAIITVALQESESLAVPSYNTILDVRTMQLSITRPSNPYVTSTTAGETERVAGPFDTEFNYSIYEGDPANLIIPGSSKMLKVFINATLFWDLQFMRYGEIGGYEVSPETGAVVGCTQVAKMDAFTDIAGVITEGVIKSPEAAPVTWWPLP